MPSIDHSNWHVTYYWLLSKGWRLLTSYRTVLVSLLAVQVRSVAAVAVEV
jgi:hypothetical protein